MAKTKREIVHGDVYGDGAVKTSYGFRHPSVKLACAWARKRGNTKLVLHRGLNKKPVVCSFGKKPRR